MYLGEEAVRFVYGCGDIGDRSGRTCKGAFERGWFQCRGGMLECAVQSGLVISEGRACSTMLVSQRWC